MYSKDYAERKPSTHSHSTVFTGLCRKDVRGPKRKYKQNKSPGTPENHLTGKDIQA